MAADTFPEGGFSLENTRAAARIGRVVAGLEAEREPRTRRRSAPAVPRARRARGSVVSSRMARRNGCTGEVEYPNGCTRFGYACSTLLALVSCVGVPLVHHLCFSNAPPAPLAPCLARHGLTPEAHAEEMAMYFRYRVEPAVTCTVETRILRGCVDDPTPVIGFQRYPPGPLRAKNARDVRDAFARVPRAFLDAADQERAATAEASSHNDDEDPTAVCSTAARALAATLPRLTSPPYDVSLADVYPFSALAADASGAPARLSYVEYACLAAVERAVELILQARGESSRGAAELRPRRRTLLPARRRRRISPRSRGVRVGGPAAGGHVPAEIDGCPGEKDTGEGREKGSDLGLGKCDFVEFANVA